MVIRLYFGSSTAGVSGVFVNFVNCSKELNLYVLMQLKEMHFLIECRSARFMIVEPKFIITVFGT